MGEVFNVNGLFKNGYTISIFNIDVLGENPFMDYTDWYPVETAKECRASPTGHTEVQIHHDKFWVKSRIPNF